MSKDLVFESDKLEKRQKIKRILIPVLVLAAIIAIVVAVAFIINKSKAPVFTGGEGTAYPFSWTENKDGSLTLQLPASGNGTYVWTPKTSVRAVGELRQEEKPKDGMQAYTLIPAAVGRTLLEFFLKNGAEGADEDDQLFAISLIVEVSREEERLKASVLGASSQTFPGIITGGEAEGFAYLIKVREDGTLFIRMKDGTESPEGWVTDNTSWYVVIEDTSPDTESETYSNETADYPASVEWVNPWECVSADEAVISVQWVGVQDGYVNAFLKGGMTAGSSEVRIQSKMGGAALSIMVAVEENGSIGIQSHVLERFEPVPPSEADVPPDWYDYYESSGTGN